MLMADGVYEEAESLRNWYQCYSPKFTSHLDKKYCTLNEWTDCMCTIQIIYREKKYWFDKRNEFESVFLFDLHRIVVGWIIGRSADISLKTLYFYWRNLGDIFWLTSSEQI